MQRLSLFALCLCIISALAHSDNRSKVHHRSSNHLLRRKHVYRPWAELRPSHRRTEQLADVDVEEPARIRSSFSKNSRHPTIERSRALWNQFKRDHNKRYQSTYEEEARFSIFHDNVHFVDRHNDLHHRGLKSYSVKLNHLADMHPDEYRFTNGFKRNYGDSLAKNHSATFLVPHHLQLPDQVDWRKNGYVTPVKNQGHCGSCWAFSTTGALEGQNFRKTGQLTSLSEQNLVDCSERYGNHGCNGGLMDQAFQYIKENGGIDTEMSYPYDAMEERCKYETEDRGAEDRGFVDVLPRGDEKKLKAAVGSVGPVSVAIDASHRGFQFYNHGVYYEPDCNPEGLDHGVLVVGYGTDNVTDDFWIVKNSWGPRWGEDGFIKMTRNRDNNCGIASAASYPLV